MNSFGLYSYCVSLVGLDQVLYWNWWENARWQLSRYRSGLMRTRDQNYKASCLRGNTQAVFTCRRDDYLTDFARPLQLSALYGERLEYIHECFEMVTLRWWLNLIMESWGNVFEIIINIRRCISDVVNIFHLFFLSVPVTYFIVTLHTCIRSCLFRLIPCITVRCAYLELIFLEVTSLVLHWCCIDGRFSKEGVIVFFIY